MAHFRRLPQALPLLKLSRPFSSTWPLVPITNSPHTRPSPPVTPYAPYTPSAAFTSTRPSRAIPGPGGRNPPPHNQMANQPIFSANQPADLPARAAHLFPTWDLLPSNKGLTREYTFSSFSKAWTFMSLVAAECKAKNHHPSWSNLYNKVTVEWTTHRPEGLSIKDVEMAEFCDRTAAEIGLKQ